MRFLYLASLLALLPVAFQAAAQTPVAPPTDSARVSYEEEVLVQPLQPDSVAPLRVQREVQSQWKLGLNNFFPVREDDFYTRYGVHLAYERKLAPAWAVQGEFSPAVIRYRQENGDLRHAPSARVQLMGRYYYNLERRIRKGKNRGSFSGNYFALAAGAGLGRHNLETPFFYYQHGPNHRGLFDVALLYGWQRRLGRYGFIDANIGVAKFFSPIEFEMGLLGSLRVGLLLGSPPAPEQQPARLGAADDARLRPRIYAGAQLGSYNYVVRFSNLDPYAGRPNGLPSLFQRPGVGTYSVENKNPYYYAGYQLQPRLALQLGYQGQAGTITSGGIQVDKKSETYEQILAFPLLLRYGLTRQYQRRLQFDVVGGVAVVYARVRNEETQYRNGQVTNVFSFARKNTDVHATGGLNVSYGIGRQRKFQVTGEYVCIQNLQTAFKDLESTPRGGSLGVRYRFGPKF